MKLRILVLGAWLCTLAPAAWAEPPKEHSRSPVTFSPQAGETVTIEQTGDEIAAKLPSGKIQALGEMEEEEFRFGATPLLQADFNFDGAGDVAVFESSGYGGVNQFYTLYLWDRAGRSFQAFADMVSNPDLNIGRKALVSGQRNGPRWYTTEYRSDAGKLYAAVERETVADGFDYVTFKNPAGQATGHKVVSNGEEDGRLSENLPDAVIQIQADKVLLYDKPDAAARTKMYVVKGDTATLLDYSGNNAETTGEDGWFLIRFKGRKVIEKWVEGSALPSP
jgi:hypothetical protein